MYYDIIFPLEILSKMLYVLFAYVIIILRIISIVSLFSMSVMFNIILWCPRIKDLRLISYTGMYFTASLVTITIYCFFFLATPE